MFNLSNVYSNELDRYLTRDEVFWQWCDLRMEVAFEDAEREAQDFIRQLPRMMREKFEGLNRQLAHRAYAFQMGCS